MTKKITGISFDKNLLETIDSQCGLVPRSAYISKIVSNFIKKQRKDGFTGSSLSLNTSTEFDNDGI